MRAAVALLFLFACGDNVPASITISSPWDLQDFVAFTPGVTLGDHGAFRIELIEDAAMPAEGYRATLEGKTILVRASDILGAQYGAAHALEALGYRFRHPYDTAVPDAPELDVNALDGALHAPETRVRGFQLHTLHPIEGYFAFWEPSAGSTHDAHRIIDWTIKNRGNFLQWVALDDILESSRYDAWQPFTRELIDYAHARGMRVGLNIQLFGLSNLQNAFDLVDSATNPVADQVAARLPIVTKNLPFDVYELSFGEFFNADPAQFIASVNEVRKQLPPSAEMHAAVHVGAKQIVSYLGQDLLYYFLVKYADPSIVSDVHTTMFYTLFEDTSGAYHHDNFFQHRDYLYEQQCAGRRPAYFPETAYWGAFDNSVPQMLPLYTSARWRDLDGLRKLSPCPDIPLDNQLLFSSGWEWSYWLHDVTALRASYELPIVPEQLVADAFGRDLVRAVEPINALADLQHQYLHQLDLMAYIASRDVAIDAGRQLDIVSQPDRITFDDLVAKPDARAEMRDKKLELLEEYAKQLDVIADRFYAIDFPSNTKRWADELRDGFEIDQLRVRFVLAIYQAAMAQVDGDPPTAKARINRARDLLADAGKVVARRHANLHDNHGRRLVDKAGDTNANRTFYQYGYLYNADTLCFWHRELTQVETLSGLTTSAPPGCLLP